MDVEVLPGPSLAERARTAIAQARLATVSWDDPASAATGAGGLGGPAGPGSGRVAVTATAAIRVDRFGQPVLLLPPREAVTEALAVNRAVTATIPAPAPLGSLALTGTVEPRPGPDGRVGYRLGLRSLRFAGPVAGGCRWPSTRRPSRTRCGGWPPAPSATWSAGTWPS